MTRHNMNDSDETVRNLYRAGATEQPPRAMDEQILAQARTVVAIRQRWTVPLSIAAVALLAIGVALRWLPGKPFEPMEMNAATEVAIEEATEAAAGELRERIARNREAMPDQTVRPSLSVTPFAADRSESAKAPQEATAMPDRVSPPAVSGVVTANVVSVRAENAAVGYRLRVAITSPDLGCQQYADWWELLSEDGALIYRDTWAESHAGRQPFERLSDVLELSPEAIVIVRAHMSNTGYGGTAQKGSLVDGFVPTVLPPAFAADVATRPPLPPPCRR
jgi:hypothetical protein